MTNMNFNFIPTLLPYFYDGVIVTIVISIIVVFFGLIIGTLMALLKLSKNKLLNIVSNVYVEVLRGTPMLVQILIGYTLITIHAPIFQVGILDVDLSRLIPGLIVLSMNSGAYVAEIVRGGINSIGQGQMEAAHSLGLKPAQAMRYVILPQAIRNILPALGNEFITVIKDSSLLTTIGIMELWNGAMTVSTITFQPLSPLLIAAAMYFVLTFLTSRLLNVYEKKISKAYTK
jgi:His/Glu/Gln/Arg/opine family amino acid ABC transporter permease subunit